VRPFVGSAVSNAALDVALRPSGACWRGANDEPGSAELVGRLPPLPPQLIVLTATGGLERLVVAALGLAGWPTAVVTPRQGRACATATGRLAKTDARAAAALAHGAAALPPAPRPVPAAAGQALAAVGARRRQVVGMLRAQQNRSQQALPTVRATGTAHLPWREQALADRDAELDQTLHASPLWRERDQLLRSGPGVGPTLALPRIAAHLPQLGQGSAKHLATLVGLAPLTRDSGTWRGTRALWGGRRQVRTALYLAALVGIRFHPVVRACSEQLLARGTPKQVALPACMHQLLTLLPAVLRDRTPWQPTLLAA
jgi:transposase